jgi:Carboxypeptidase regulatory-like domain
VRLWLVLVYSLSLLFTPALREGVGHAQTRTQTKPEAKHNVVARYQITGVVVSSIDASAVPHCRIVPSLEVHGSFGNRRFPASNVSFEADDHGRFSITVPSAGAWNLTASARNYVDQAYEEHGGFASSIVLTADSPTIDIRFKISPEAGIKGVVVDEAGEAVRDAQIALHVVPPQSPGGPQAAVSTRTYTQTDDRGMYELSNLSPGSYRLTVQARPWYAQIAQQGATASSLDPSLDMAYPLTWFPGSNDAATAETIVLHAGDTRQADFQLVPIPSIHLKIIPPPRVTELVNSRQGQAFPIVEEINAGSTGPRPISISTRRDSQGQFDVSGLTPGLYRVRLGGPGQGGQSTMVDVTANSVRTVDLGAPSNDIARVTIHVDGYSEAAEEFGGRRGMGFSVNLINTGSQRGTFSSMNSEGGFGGRTEARNRATDRTIEVPPGHYEVVLQGRPAIYLIGLTAKGAQVSGRYVTVPAGETTLTVHVANGHATISGIATLEGKPAVAAMVLLVPITIEEPDSIGFLRQDQTNTDGSFDIENVIPGQYILVAIDRGWQINWGDRSTLRRYLANGVPIELKPSATMKQNIIAQAP